MYCGLNIATAKITEEEKEGIPHHLFSFLESTQECDVGEFKELALKKAGLFLLYVRYT